MDDFVGWIRSSNNPRWHDEKILPGEYSDDTQLTPAVAWSIIAGDWETFFAEKELPFWLNYERGGGGTLLKAAKREHSFIKSLFILIEGDIMPRSNILMYTTEDGITKIEVTFDHDTVWLSID